MTINFPYTHSPKRWKDVVFQDTIKTIISSWLRHNSFPSFIFAQGNTGLGKTCVTKLMIQTVHCLRRTDGEIHNCEECAVCRSDPQLTTGYNNVVWVTAGNSKDADDKEITYQQSIKDALALADKGPIPTGTPHRDILFIVFEEAHLMPKDLFQRCLAKADTQNPYAGDVVFVFLTMSPEEIGNTARQAISQRGAILNFVPPTTIQLQEYLLAKFEGFDANAAWLMAVSADNSIRGALSAYKDCLDFQDPITIHSAAQRLRFLDPKSRYQLWQMLKDRTKVRTFSERAESLLQQTSPVHLAKVLLRDLDAEYELLGEDVWWAASKLINEFLRRPTLINLSYALHNLRNLEWPPDFPKDPGTFKLLIYESLMSELWPTLY